MKEYDSKIIQSIVNFEEKEQKILVANSKGIYQKDHRPYIMCSMTAVAKDNKNMEEFNEHRGRSMGLEIFDLIDLEDIAKKQLKKQLCY